MRLKVRQDLNHWPVLVAEAQGGANSRVLYDPNPQLQGIELGEAVTVTWRDETGYEFRGGLVKPPDYVPGKRYPPGDSTATTRISSSHTVRLPVVPLRGKWLRWASSCCK